jgi:hypothetical protein
MNAQILGAKKAITTFVTAPIDGSQGKGRGYYRLRKPAMVTGLWGCPTAASL